MSTEPLEAFFLPDGTGFRATLATRGPWSPDHQHGGPPSALLARALELDAARAETPFRPARITVAFHRPIPIDRFDITVETVREGKKVRIARANLVDSGGRSVATAEALFVRRASIGVAASPDVAPRAPEACEPYVFSFFASVVGYHVAMECRTMSGSWGSGKMAMWMRMAVPLVPGETPSPLQRVVVAADSGNGISVGLDLRKYTFINPDLTVVLARELEGEWVGVDAESRFGPDGVGLATSTLLDTSGAVGHGLQTLVLDAR